MASTSFLLEGPQYHIKYSKQNKPKHCCYASMLLLNQTKQIQFKAYWQQSRAKPVKCMQPNNSMTSTYLSYQWPADLRGHWISRPTAGFLSKTLLAWQSYELVPSHKTYALDKNRETLSIATVWLGYFLKSFTIKPNDKIGGSPNIWSNIPKPDYNVKYINKPASTGTHCWLHNSSWKFGKKTITTVQYNI